MGRLVLFVALVGFSLLPQRALAADVYANSVTSSGSNVWSPSLALGAPDGAYADFRAQDATILFDLGEGEEGTGDLALYVYLLQTGAQFLVTFYDADLLALGSNGDFIENGASSAIASYDGTAPYRYVRVTSPDTEQWRLDAVEVFALAETGEEDNETPAPESDATTPAPSYEAGTLLMSEESSAVYILGSDGYRHAFPNESVFTSWSLSFDDVVTVDASTLAAYSLGRNVTVRPGTWLVKLATNPKVYAVEPGGVLRWVAGESIALQLYGVDWTTRVLDVSDAFFGNYTVGEDIDTVVHPDGSVVMTRAGDRYYIADASLALLDDATVATLRLTDTFTVSLGNSAILDQYAESVASLLVEGAEWPY